MSETCGNCNRSIGNLETPHLHQGHIVCPQCAVALAPPVMAYAAPVAAVSSTSPIEKAGDAVALTIRFLAFLVVLGIIVLAGGIVIYNIVK